MKLTVVVEHDGWTRTTEYPNISDVPEVETFYDVEEDADWLSPNRVRHVSVEKVVLTLRPLMDAADGVWARFRDEHGTDRTCPLCQK